MMSIQEEASSIDIPRRLEMASSDMLSPHRESVEMSATSSRTRSEEPRLPDLWETVLTFGHLLAQRT